mmetsp:Transcript_10996/g.21532  ORF Transcript_10996/g.21532 Transcript_10996/m.21532 type:complete len:498 (-) Transcript_10996:177-1670(-)
MDSHSQNPTFLFLNRSFFTLKDCINSFGEVGQLIEDVSARINACNSLDTKPSTGRTQSFGRRTNVCSVYQDIAARSRRSKRVSIDPAPGQYFTRPVSCHQPEARMEGRPEIPQLSSPGPAAYSALQKEDVKFGYWNREPRYKQIIHEDSHLGPGAYDVPSFVNTGHRGHNIDAGKSDNSGFWKTSSLSLGPGQYMVHEGYSSKGYTIAKTKRAKDQKFNSQLGPGKYEYVAESPASAFKFSLSPRFDNSFTDKVNTFVMSNPYTKKGGTVLNTDYKEKINDFKPERRRQLITQAAKVREHKIEATQRTKTALMEHRRLLKEQTLQSKFQKFEWRMNKPELRAVFKSWSIVAVALGCLKIVDFRLVEYKEYKAKIKFLLTLFFNVSKFVGKFLTIRRTLAVRRSYIVMRRLRIPMRKKVAKMKLRKAKVLAETLEEYSSGNVIFKLMLKWKRSILLLQRFFLKMIRQKRLIAERNLKANSELQPQTTKSESALQPQAV